MKRKILSCLLLFSVVACSPKPVWVPYDGIIKAVYPDEHWQKAIAPEQLGWSSEKLAGCTPDITSSIRKNAA